MVLKTGFTVFVSVKNTCTAKPPSHVATVEGGLTEDGQNTIGAVDAFHDGVCPPCATCHSWPVSLSLSLIEN